MEYVVQGVVSFRLLIVLVALTRLLEAGEPGARTLDAEAVRRILLPSARLDAGLGVAFTETVDHTPPKGKPYRTVRHWRVRGDAYRGQTSCLSTWETSKRTTYVVRAGAEIYRVYRHDDHWTSFTDKIPVLPHKQNLNFPIASAYQRALRPFNRGAWDGCLKRDSILQATIEENRVTAVFVRPFVADAFLRGLKMHGPIGWRCTFKQFQKRYVLDRMEYLTTPEEWSFDFKTGKGSMIPTKNVLENRVVRVLGRPYAVLAVIRFDDYVKIRELVIPRQMERRSATTRTVVRIDAQSLIVTDLSKDPFAFAPPKKWGRRGRHWNRITGERKEYK